MRQKEQEKLDKAAWKVKPKRKTDDCEKVWTDCGDDTTSIDLPHVVHFTDTVAERQLMLDEIFLAELSDMSCFFRGGPLPPGNPHPWKCFSPSGLALGTQTWLTLLRSAVVKTASLSS